jgi:hypothetical protein
VARDVADAVDVRDRGSAELHDEAGHVRDCVSNGSARSQAQIATPPRQKARIHSGGGVGPQPKP